MSACLRYSIHSISFPEKTLHYHQSGAIITISVQLSPIECSIY
jgi:hypothetical protein